MNVAVQVWTLIGIIIAGGVAFSVAILGKIDGLRAEFIGANDALRAEFIGANDGLRTELKGEIGELRADLKSEIGESRTDLKGEIGELRTELKGEIAVTNARIDTINVELHTMNRTLGELVAMAHTHEHVA